LVYTHQQIRKLNHANYIKLSLWIRQL
jgi:hypothetical protein